MLFVAAQIYLILSIFSFHSHLHIFTLKQLDRIQSPFRVAQSITSITQPFPSLLPAPQAGCIAPIWSQATCFTLQAHTHQILGRGSHPGIQGSGRSSSGKRALNQKKSQQNRSTASYCIKNNCMWIQNLIRIGGALG